jgi:hypothetical protein
LLMITKESSWQMEFHMEQVWQQRIIITGCKNCAEKCTKTDLTCSGMGHSFCTTMHALTWGRLWPICWVNTSGKCYLMRHTVHPLDFDLFPKLKETMRGHRFPSLEMVSAAGTRDIWGLNKSGTLNGIANLPKRWDAVIEKQGDYTERL